MYEPNANYETDNNTSDLRVGQQKRQNAHLAPLPMPLTKKQGVSGESCDTARQSASDISIQKYEKDFRYFDFSLTLSLEFEIKKKLSTLSDPNNLSKMPLWTMTSSNISIVFKYESWWSRCTVGNFPPVTM